VPFPLPSTLLTGSTIKGTYEETPLSSSSTPVNPNSAVIGDNIEYDFVVQNNLAQGGAEYCFRLATSQNNVNIVSPLNGGYTVYPRIHVNEELTFSLNNTNVTFGTLGAGNSFTAVTSVTTTVSTNAGQGYVIRSWSTSKMSTPVDLPQFKISDWTGTNAVPTDWSVNCITDSVSCGFGYNSDDLTLSGGTANRFNTSGTNNLYAAFIHGDNNSNGDPVADETATTISATTKHQINLKISVPSGQAAGVYKTTLLFIATPTF
jgi:hypothetical protein